MEQLPIYNAVIEDSMDGIFAISLVDSPAVESNFIAFSKDSKNINFAIENEEEHNILGCILRADYPIYRIGEQGEEYYIKFSKDTIVKMAEKMLSDHTFNFIDLNHDCGDIPSGVTLRQLFVKDITKGVNPVGFEDVEDGSLFALYHVDSMDLWERIKSGEFKGFSVEAWLSLVKVEMSRINKVNNNSNNNKTVRIMNKIKEALKKLLMEFGTVETDKGTLNYEGDGDLKAGDVVTLDDGNTPEDGDYTTEDGKVITVKDGKVEEIKDPEAEVADEETETETEVEAEDEKPEDETPAETETPEEDEKPEDDGFDAKAEIENLKAEIEAIKKLVNEIANTPATPSVEEEFSKTPKRDEKLSKAQKYFNALG